MTFIHKAQTHAQKCGPCIVMDCRDQDLIAQIQTTLAGVRQNRRWALRGANGWFDSHQYPSLPLRTAAKRRDCRSNTNAPFQHHPLERGILLRRKVDAGDNHWAAARRANYIFFPALLLSSDCSCWPAGVALTSLPPTISRALTDFPYRRWLASLSGSSEAPSSDTPAKSPEVRA